ncbi:MAG: hypothetical protein JKY50_00665 [Oleispira sp.]|nr:hypothetical protein [Oleispira sp.]
MNNLDTPMTRIQWLLLTLIFVSSILGIKLINEHLRDRVWPPVALNSLPRSVIKCTPGAIEGLCANDEYAKNWEAMQND